MGTLVEDSSVLLIVTVLRIWGRYCAMTVVIASLLIGSQKITRPRYAAEETAGGKMSGQMSETTR